jgi:hypothetical protein
VFAEIGRRLRMAGLPGLISGAETPRDKASGTVIVTLTGLALLAIEGFLVAFAGAAAVAVLWGLWILIRKRRAGASINSTDY